MFNNLNQSKHGLVEEDRVLTSHSIRNSRFGYNELFYFMGLRHALLIRQWGTPYNSPLTELFLKYLAPCLKTRTKIYVDTSA